MSDIGILNGPFGLAFIFLVLGAPGFPLGAIAGALIWRTHRVLGALAGAVVGFAMWLLGWLYFTNSL